MILEIVILSLLFVVSAITSLPHILQFQLADYLVYRYRAMILDSSLVHMLFPRKLSMPAKSLRNIIILGVVFLTLLSYSIWIFIFTDILLSTFALSLIMYPLAKAGVLIGVLVTTPLAWVMRYRRIMIAERQFRSSDVKVIGITGSYGKSTVKEILHRILSVRYLTAKTRANHNTNVGIAIEAGLQITPHTEYFVAEMGAYREHDIAKLCKMYKPEIGVVTGVGNQHVTLFGNKETIKRTKLEMVKGVDKGPVFVNIDWKGALDYLKTNGYLGDNVITYGEHSHANARIEDVRIKNGSTVFTLTFKGKKENYTTRLLGKHNVINAVPAILIAKKLGMEYREIYQVLSELEPVLGKLSIHNSVTGFRILNDGYNSNVNGFKAAMDVLADMKEHDKYISTLGLFELGREKKKAYDELVDYAGKLRITILTTDAGMLTAKGNSTTVKVFENEDGILEFIKNVNPNNSVLLLEGRHSYGFTRSLGLTKVY